MGRWLRRGWNTSPGKGRRAALTARPRARRADFYELAQEGGFTRSFEALPEAFLVVKSIAEASSIRLRR